MDRLTCGNTRNCEQLRIYMKTLTTFLAFMVTALYVLYFPLSVYLFFACSDHLAHL